MHQSHVFVSSSNFDENKHMHNIKFLQTQAVRECFKFQKNDPKVGKISS